MNSSPIYEGYLAGIVFIQELIINQQRFSIAATAHMGFNSPGSALYSGKLFVLGLLLSTWTGVTDFFVEELKLELLQLFS